MRARASLCYDLVRGTEVADSVACGTELALENAAINADLALGVGPMSAGSVYGMAHPLYGDPYLRDGDLGYGSLGAFDDPFYDDGLY